MKTNTVSFALLSFLAVSHAASPSPTTLQTASGSGVKIVTYYSAITTLPPLEEHSAAAQHLELRQAGAAAGAGRAGGAAGAQPAAVQPAAGAAAQPAAVQPVAGAAPAVGVGGAGAVPAAAQPASTNPGQVSPVTTVNVFSVVQGVTKQVPIVYTQKFSSIPSQGPTPAKGEIGLGTLTGKIGVVNTAEAKKGSASRRTCAGFGVFAVAALGMLVMWA